MKRANSPDKRKEIRILFTAASIFVACFFGASTLAQGGDTTSSGAIGISTKAQGNVYYVATDGDDDINPGTEAQPFRTITKGLQTVQNGDVLIIKAGTYRLMEEDTTFSFHLSRPDATPDSFVTIQAYEGERVSILGSLSSEGQTWEQYNDTLWRLPAEFLVRNPAGMFCGATRIAHQMEWRGDTRSHADITALTAPGEWTKADASGAGCGSSNTGCYIYLYPSEEPNTQTYEFSQRKLFHSVGTSYLTVRGLEFAYTQDAAFSIEGGRGQVIEDNTLSHNSNGNGNAYAVFICYGGGAHVLNNEVFDSEYWGGTPNSKGITFMTMDADDPSLVEGNEVYDIIGQGITSKSGVSNLIVRGNYIHHVGVGIEPPGGRCHWTKPDCQPGDPEYYPGGNWDIHENILVENESGVSIWGTSEASTSSDNNTIHNNVFYSHTGAAINIPFNPSGTVIANNIFLGNARGVYLNNGGSGDTRTVEDFLVKFSSDYNLFFDNFYDGTADYFLRKDWTGPGGSGTAYELAQIQTDYARESHSLSSADPCFIDTANIDFHLQLNSPARNAGDGSFYQVAHVDMGAYPNLPPTAVTDLHVTRAVTTTDILTATLRWTAPTDAVTYTLRYSDTLISDDNWASAVIVSVPFTATPGSTEWLTAPISYSGGTAYFALKSQNTHGEWSALSNNAFWPHFDIWLPLVLR